MLMDTESAPFAIAFFLGMVLFLELGRRIGRRMHADTPERAPTGVGAVEGAVFALFGLLIAFTFSGAASRFDDRRHLIIDEANDIGTAWSYLDLLPVNEQGLIARPVPHLYRCAHRHF
jgi:MFS family permease